MATSAINHIIIIGGGSAGWLSAGLIAAQGHLTHNAKVTLIESPEVATLGVGEGTWPTMRKTLKTIGISETQFIRECDASFKQGSRFDGWCDDKSNDDSNDYYHHPFSLPVAYQSLNIAPYWFAQQQAVSFSHAVASQTYFCDHHKAPKTHLHSDYQAQANYGYHLDAGKFAQLLMRHCLDKLNVNHLLSHVDEVINDEDGYISGVKTRDHGLITGDLFIDCSGHHGRLIDKHYQVPLESQQHILFNNRAVAVQVPYASSKQAILSYIKATAQEVFSAASYQFILYGMKHLPAFPKMNMPASIIEHFTNNQQAAKQGLANLPTNRQLLEHIQKFGLQPI